MAAQLLPDNPCDGHTLADTWTAVQAVTGVAVTDAYVDKGYRGHGCPHTVNVDLPGQRSASSRAERRRRRRRSAIEPNSSRLRTRIGHLKSDPFEAQGMHRMDRFLRGSGQGFLTGLAGDAINAVLAAASNPSPLRACLRKLLRRLAAALMGWLGFAIGTLRPPSIRSLSG